MTLADLLEPDTRTIEVGATGPEVARELTERGRPRYLGLVAPDRLDAVRARAGELAHRFVALESVDQAVRNSTDLLILRGRSVGAIWGLRDLRHVRWVAVEVTSPAAALEAGVVRLLGRVAGKLTPRGRYRCGGRSFDVVEVGGARPERARRYLSPVWGVDGLIERLDAASVRYVVLRWFEDLPDLQPGEDLDVLTTDADLQRFRDLLAQEPGTIPVDLYSETGLPGADFRGAAYYPPSLAGQLLDRAVTHRSGCRVPDPLDHLCSLAYHALYHKGHPSGLPSEHFAAPFPTPEHDYAGVLAALARTLGVELPATMEGIDRFLAERGWRPPPDTLRRLATSNAWIERRFLADPAPPAGPPEPAVFLVRARTLEVVTIDEVVAELAPAGFEVLAVRALDTAAADRCAHETRGGNWGAGPFAVSGGGPRYVIVAAHYGPRPVPAWQRERYPRLTNADVLRAKLGVRDLVAARVAPGEEFNPIHSSDDEQEAWEYVELALPEELDHLREQVEQRREAYRTGAPVVRTLSSGRRAKVEVVEGDRGPVVRKTFAAHAARFRDRELRAMRELGPHLEAVPDLLATGPNWFEVPWYDDQLAGVGDVPGGALVPLEVLHRMVEVLRRIHEVGGDLVDAKPQNFLLDRDRGLKLVDYEFFHRYEGAAPAFAESYAFVGVPDGFAGDVPLGELSYEVRWRPYTGLSLDALLHAPRWSQHARRLVFRCVRGLIGPRGALRYLGRTTRDQARRARRVAGGSYHRLAVRRARSAITGEAR